MKQVVAFVVVAGLVVGPAEATVYCGTPPESFGDPPFADVPSADEIAATHAHCLQLRRDRHSNMRSAELGELDAAQVLELARGYEDDEFGCPDDGAFAFRLIEAAVPDPVPATYDTTLAEGLLLSRLEAGLDQYGADLAPERVRNIRNMLWFFRSSQTYQPSDADVAGMLADPALMAIAEQHFGRNRARDLALLDALENPASPLFDREEFARLAVQAYLFHRPPDGDGMLLNRAASLLLDPTHGTVNLAAAWRVLGQGDYSPFLHQDDAVDQVSAQLWQRVGQGLSSSADPEERAFAEGLLASGDPLFRLRTVNTALPENARYLDEIPVQFGEPRDWDRVQPRIADAYPRRAQRLELFGLVETAYHYAPDGSYVGLVVLQSSGTGVLDDSAIMIMTRYVRPRPLAVLPPELLTGQDLLIRLPKVAFHFNHQIGEPAAERLPDGTIVVTGFRVEYQDFC